MSERRDSRAIVTDPPPPDPDLRVVYGPEPLQFGDLRLPAGPGPHPLLVVVHGGFWQAIYNLTHAGHLCRALQGEGIATWNVEYRRIGDPGGGWPGTLEDLARAVDFVRELAPRHGLDLDRVALFGHSAGGHLALWAAGRHRVPADALERGDDPLPVRGVVSCSGVVDLEDAARRGVGRGIVDRFLGGTPDEVPDRYAAASPAALLPLGVPQRLVHGSEDVGVPYDLSETYVRRARDLGDDAVLVTLAGAEHFEPVDPHCGHWPQVVATVQEVLA